MNNLTSNPQNLKSNIKKLTEIVDWFSKQAEIDLEESIKKVRQAALLLKDCKARLREIENEFEEIKKDIEKEVSR